jgi:hypothetical protein
MSERWEYFFRIHSPTGVENYGPFNSIQTARRKGNWIYSKLLKAKVTPLQMFCFKKPFNRPRLEFRSTTMKPKDIWTTHRVVLYSDSIQKMIKSRDAAHPEFKDYCMKMNCDNHPTADVNVLVIPDESSVLVICAVCNAPIAELVLAPTPEKP